MLRIVVLLFCLASAMMYAKEANTSYVWDESIDYPFLNPLDSNWWNKNAPSIDTLWFFIHGDSIVAKWELPKNLVIAKPQIKDLYAVQKSIEELCLANGYPFATNYFRFDAITDSTAVIGIKIEQGPAYLLGNPVFSGSSTKSKILLRLYQTESSEYFHPQKIKEGIARLRATEYYDSIELQGYYRPLHQRLIIPRITITDRKQSSLLGAGGYNAESAGSQNPWQGLFAADVYNLLGTARDLHLYWKGDNKTTNLRAAYREPWIGSLPWSINLKGELYWQDSTYRESKADFELINESSSTQKWGVVGGAEATFERNTELDTSVTSAAYYSGLVYRYKKVDRIDLPQYGFIWETIGKISNRVSDNSEDLMYKNEIDISMFYTWHQIGLHPRILSKSTWPADRAMMVAGDMWRLGGFQNLRGIAEDVFLVPAYYLGRCELFYDLGKTTRVYGFGDLAWLDKSTRISDRWEGGYGLGLIVGQSNWWLNLSLAGNSDRSFEEYLLFVQIENRF